MNFPFPTFLLLSILFACANAAFDPSNYSNSSQLNQDYLIYWKVDAENKTINLALQVKTEGWIGFGIGEPTSGSMPGADVVVVSFETPDGGIGDYFAVDFVLPSRDSCQDWRLLSSQLSNGVRTVEISRALNTTDTQDRPIVPGLNRIVFAYGNSDSPTLRYHGSNRKMTALAFWNSEDEAVIPERNVSTTSFQLNNFPVPNVPTTYSCIALPIPIPRNSPDNHVIQIDPIITSKYAHHLLVHICDNITDGYVQKYYKNAGSCVSPVGNPYSGCHGLLFAWALGIGSLVVPQEAGYRMGYSKTAFDFVVIEVHLNNPERESGGFDSSGAIIHYTPDLRKYDAATLTLGDPFISFPPIPAGVKSRSYEAECTSSCTSMFSHSINVFSSFHHMHEIGKQLWTTQYRNGAFLGTTNRVDFYEYGAQQQTRMNFTINPGDSLNTHCVFDSTTRSSTTIFGVESDDEMCMDFISYYPALEFKGSTFAYCGFYRYAGFPTPNVTVCGSQEGLLDMSSIMFELNPQNSDLAATSGKVFGTPPPTCTIPNATSSLFLQKEKMKKN